MNKYAGIPCPVCGKKFTDIDDIVVCPDCGAPHHRDCYQELGSCVFTSRHAPDFTWKNPDAPAREQLPPTPGGVPGGQQNAADYSRNFSEADSRDASPGGFPPPGGIPGGMPGAEGMMPGVRIDESIDGIPIKDLAQFIGPNAYYYLLRFKAFAANRQGIIVNFSAMIFGFLYYFYRRMYKWGAVMLALFCVCMLPSFILVYRTFPDFVTAMMNTLANGTPDTVTFPASIAANGMLGALSQVGEWVYFAACFFSGMYANKLYFSHAKETVTGLRDRFGGRPDQELSHALAIRGRTNIFAVIAIVGLLALACFAFGTLVVFIHRNLLF